MGLIDKSWITGLDVLDIGCNAGHLTLLLARDHHPRKIVGVDIDPVLIQYAQKNIRLGGKSSPRTVPRDGPLNGTLGLENYNRFQTLLPDRKEISGKFCITLWSTSGSVCQYWPG